MTPAGYIIIANGPTASQRDVLSNALNGTGVGWWHWYQDAWIVTDPQRRGVVSWRDWVGSIVPGMQFLVLEGTGRWTGISDPSHFVWLYQNYGSAS